MDFIEGSHTQAAINSMIINETLAWRLFGTTENITGLTVWIGGTQYIISGVVRLGENNTAWVPRDEMNTLVSSLYIRPIYSKIIFYSCRCDVVCLCALGRQ
ncbi:MAG: hypothetical protein FWE27_04235 [Defluviitaleaceae bacterium]|nr:hypothetical protein [Defluviitaleaceae bacterium]